jgi:hypothetical protein
MIRSRRGAIPSRFMDQYSILDRNSSGLADEADGSPVRAAQVRPATISAQIAAANAVLSRSSDAALRFPGEDYGRSLAQMAHADLDATLQLLADRAQYITGASGAAIALRRGQHKDMLCRASAGWNAPQPGALLSMDYGLSGESVRTRQLLRCDDAEHDPRVNREVCRELRIVSVVIVPILSDDQVLGVFELFSGRPRAFEERDISALLRLSEMVETAVKYAVAGQGLPVISDAPMAESQPRAESRSSPGPVPSPVKSVPPQPLSAKPIPMVQPMAKQSLAEQPKPLLWSASMRAQSAPPQEESTSAVAVPPVLRRLQKCQACGFPVSQGRTFCIECEDKQWRGQALAKSMAVKQPQQNPVAPPIPQSSPQPDFATHTVALPTAPQAAIAFLSGPVPIDASLDGNPTLLNSALRTESWLASNKYVLGALFVVAAILSAITWLR